MTKTFEIYYDDLTEDCKKRLDEFLDIEPGDDNNWAFSPITMFEIEDDNMINPEDRIQ